jgi:hypothetical protein
MTMTTDAPAWLAALKEGDRVVLEVGRSGTSYAARVARLTATQILVPTPGRPDFTMRFRRETGDEIKARGAWDAPNRIVEPTPERLAAIRHRRLADRLRRTVWQQESLATLEAVAAALGIA